MSDASPQDDALERKIEALVPLLDRRFGCAKVHGPPGSGFYVREYTDSDGGGEHFLPLSAPFATAREADIEAKRYHARLILRCVGGAREPVHCPIGLEASHHICSAGYCDVCQQDLRKQWGIQHAEIARMTAGLVKAREALVDVMSWIDNWDPDFIHDGGWSTTANKAHEAIAQIDTIKGVAP